MNNRIKQGLRRIIPGLGLVLIVALTSLTSIYFTQKKVLAPTKLLSNRSNSATIASQLLATSSTKTQLPKLDLTNLQFQNVERHEVANAKATVVYVPQIHREPTSQPSDAQNNQAVLVQKEISTILEKLVNTNGVKYVMDETDLYGPMPSDKVAKIKAGLKEIAQFKKDLQTTLARYVKDGGSQQTANAIQQSALNQISQVERRIYLTGGAAVVAAQDSNARVYGSQNAQTIAVAQEKLQNLVYLQQRIAQLQGSSGSASTNSSSSIFSLLNSNSTSGANSFRLVLSYAQQKNDSQLLQKTQQLASELQSLSSQTSFESTTRTTATTAPTDPYKNRTDLTNLQNEYTAAQADFMKIAKDQRSQEVADNIDQMMTANNVKASTLVFGVGHKAEIIDALNKKGISVIVVMPVSEVGAAAQYS